MRKGLLVGIAAASLAGCTVGGGIQMKKVAFVLPPSATKAESFDKEVCLAVPNGWRQGVDKIFDMSEILASSNNAPASNGPIDPNNPPMSAEDKKALEGLANTFDEISRDQEEQHLGRLRKNGIILMAISVKRPAREFDRTRFYVKKETQNTNWTWEEAAKAQYEKFNTKVKPTMVTLPIGQAARMEETWAVGDGVNHTLVVYAIPQGRDLYSLRFITEEPKEVVLGIEKLVAESFRIN